jgi:hypothetical protein
VAARWAEEGAGHYPASEHWFQVSGTAQFLALRTRGLPDKSKGLHRCPEENHGEN